METLALYRVCEVKSMKIFNRMLVLGRKWKLTALVDFQVPRTNPCSGTYPPATPVSTTHGDDNLPGTVDYSATND